MRYTITTTATLLVCGLLCCQLAYGQNEQILSKLTEVSKALNSSDLEQIDDKSIDLIRTLKRISSREEEASEILSSIDYFLSDHPDNLSAHDVIYELLQQLRKLDRKKQYSSEIIARVKTFNLLLFDSEMIEKNVELAERIDSETADTIANYLRNNSKITQQIKRVKEEKLAIDLTLREAKDEFQNFFDKTMDSMQMVFQIDSLKRVQIAAQLKQEKVNLALQKSKSQTIIISLFAIGAALLLLGLLYFNLIRSSRKVKKQKKVIEQEKEKYEALLLNILPTTIANELKEHGSVKPQYYKEVTVFFADFVDFSRITQKLTKEQLIKDINSLFSIFDDLTDKYDIEKIKTIGDSYMCVSGLPDSRTHSARKVIQFSEEVIQALEIWNKSRTSIFLPSFDIRIGIHTGPVTAGVVGKKKFTYDIWGHTVNTASRMESKSDKNRINISETTLALVKEYYQVEARGSIAIKNMGEVNMYFIEKQKS